MKTTPLILAGAWILSLGAAFTLGSKLSPEGTAAPSNQAEARENSRSGQRSAARSRTNAPGEGNRGSSSRATSEKGNSEESAIVTVMQNTDPVSRAKALLDLINQLGANDFEQVVTDFRAMGMTQERMSEYAMLMHAWGKTDPLAALEFAEKNTGTPFARQTVLASWAADSPDAALSWAQQNHEGDDANPWLIGVIRGLVTSNPTRATEIMQMLPYSRERGDALSSIAPYIAKMGTEKANEWLQGIQDERLRQGGAAYLAEAMASQDPAKAAQWVLSLQDTEAIKRAASSVAGKWADTDLDAAVAWTDALPAESRSSAARRVIYEYAGKDPAAAASWLKTMSNQEGYDRVVESYIWTTARKNPEMSLAQVPEIKDSRSQQRYYDRILRSWHERDADAANTWMDNNNISDELRKSVQTPRERRR